MYTKPLIILIKKTSEMFSGTCVVFVGTFSGSDIIGRIFLHKVSATADKIQIQPQPGQIDKCS